ncbi:MAG TPA: S26 family signal peptidase, partial [Candidatus Saccharimonadales bacterium]|nr:S26 family signal peptidase [Candidatus Saccharimonadales bacterium]
MDSIQLHSDKHPATDSKLAGGNSGGNPRRELFSTIAILILAPILAILLTVFVFQSYQVDGPSMESTLHNNDRLIVTKVGKTWSRITG